ncbi:MAG TPA: hypothetical protein VM146_08815 [Steroidobacteraceae bacterium]|nr:hypothetical protein [Steroidobacteraceae bacterium]
MNRALVLASFVVGATLLAGGAVRAANTPPISAAWNITSAGKAESSGELLFRVTGAGNAPVEVSVFVLSGTNETGVASSIRRALSTQLGQSYNVEAGEGANVLLSSDRRSRGFSVELVDSDVENVRVSVQSATPVAPPTVPRQQVPANTPAIPSTPSAPGSARPPGDSPPVDPGREEPSSPPAAPSSPPAGPSSPPADPCPPPVSPPAPSATPASPPTAPSSPPAGPSVPEGTPAGPPAGSSPESAPADGGAGAPASVPPPPPGNR